MSGRPLLVYVAGPYSAPTSEEIEENCRLARNCGRCIAAITGVFPLVPHQLGIGIEEIGDYKYWIAATLEVMRRCDAVFAMSTYKSSKGARGEIVEATLIGLPVFFAVAEVAEWAASRRNVE